LGGILCRSLLEVTMRFGFDDFVLDFIPNFYKYCFSSL
jgi:hypothetical protein